jgi:hypothetical protein
MDEGSEIPLLVRSFLEIGRVLINIELGEHKLRFNDKEIMFNVFEVMRHRKGSPQCYRVNVINNIVKKESNVESPNLCLKISPQTAFPREFSIVPFTITFNPINIKQGQDQLTS